MLAGIKAEADARGARRIVFDAVDALLSLLDDPLAERREIYRLDRDSRANRFEPSELTYCTLQSLPSA